MFAVLMLCVLIGLLPALIAQAKGRSFVLWWIYGALLFIVALPHALLMGADLAAQDRRALSSGDSRKCPHCAEVIRREASVCRYCSRDVAAQLRTADDYLG